MEALEQPHSNGQRIRSSPLGMVTIKQGGLGKGDALRLFSFGNEVLALEECVFLKVSCYSHQCFPYRMLPDNVENNLELIFDPPLGQSGS